MVKLTTILALARAFLICCTAQGKTLQAVFTRKSPDEARSEWRLAARRRTANGHAALGVAEADNVRRWEQSGNGLYTSATWHFDPSDKAQPETLITSKAADRTFIEPGCEPHDSIRRLDATLLPSQRVIEMIAVIGYWLSAPIALGIVLIGARFLITPYAAAAGFGVPVVPDPRWDAYLSVKGIRDIAAGLFTAILIINRSTHLLGFFMLAATIIPLADATIVIRHGGPKATAIGIHGATAGFMLIISGFLLFD